MQSAPLAMKCIWCNGPVDITNQLEVAYQTCSDCLVPLPTE